VAKRVLLSIAGVSIAGIVIIVFLWPRDRMRDAESDGWAVREAAAVYWLRKLASVQASVQVSGAIDADRDEVGEFATILELKGAVGVRRGLIAPHNGNIAGADFSVVGTVITLDTGDLAFEVDMTGVATNGDYLFRVYLPDSGSMLGWVHETGDRATGGLNGGTGKVGIDRAEKRWRAVAWPAMRKEGGRAYTIDETGVVLESENVIARWMGRDRSPTAECSLPVSIEVGAVDGPYMGRDGDRWSRWESHRVRERVIESRDR
jgi:hypothetical protein